MTLIEELNLHKLFVDADVMGCQCGRQYSTDWVDATNPDDTLTYARDQHNIHYHAILLEWLATHQYGEPFGELPRSTTCLHCGCLVGQPDQHRKVCP